MCVGYRSIIKKLLVIVRLVFVNDIQPILRTEAALIELEDYELITEFND
jgi:hypothetical protein